MTATSIIVSIITIATITLLVTKQEVPSTISVVIGFMQSAIRNMLGINF